MAGSRYKASVATVALLPRQFLGTRRTAGGSRPEAPVHPVRPGGRRPSQQPRLGSTRTGDDDFLAPGGPFNQLRQTRLRVAHIRDHRCVVVTRDYLGKQTASRRLWVDRAPGVRFRFLLLVLLAGCAHAGPFAYRRVYTAGDRYRYQLRATSTMNGVSRGETRALSVHEVVGPPPFRERIRFERLTASGRGDLSGALGALPRYEVSIASDAPPGALALPSLRGLDEALVGMITDLHTILVAVSPAVGAASLARLGDVHVDARPRLGSWTDGISVTLGEDCTMVTSRLVELSVETATIETSFDPPSGPCLTIRAPWMAPGSNFQNVRRTDAGYTAMSGREKFQVRAVVRRSDGRLVQASLLNQLALTIRPACDETLLHCGPELSATLERQVTVAPADQN
jgi:hypothetical protein